MKELLFLRGPVAKGLLSGKYNKASNFSDIIRAGFNPDGGEREKYESMLAEVEKIKELVKKYPNDMELGGKVRHLIYELEIKGKEYSDWKNNWDSAGSL